MSTREQKLVRAFVELSDTLVTDYDVSELLYTLVERCVDIFGVAGAGLMLADDSGHLRVMAHSGPEARFIELLEVQQREGPCFDAYLTGHPVSSRDLEEDADRWPYVVAESLRAGYRSVYAVPLRLRDEVVGAMNLFQTGPGELSGADQAALRGLAEIATIAILHGRALSDAQQVADQLETALRTRVVIEQAKGMISVAASVGVDEAFARLRQYARNHGVRLDDVARRVISGDLDSQSFHVIPAKD